MVENDIQIEKMILEPALDLKEPSEELLKWAETNIGEDPDIKDLLVSDLRDMIYERGECTPGRVDDEFLIRFLRARHFLIKPAHKLYVNYHKFEEDAPQYFKNVNIGRILEICKKKIFNIPPNRDQLGRRMLLLRIGDWVPSEFTPTELIQAMIIFIQLTLLEASTQIKGAVLLVDLSGISLEMIWYLSPSLAKHIVTIATSSFPIRLEAVHFIFTSWIFDTGFAILKSFIPKSFRNRLHFHNDLETLYHYQDPKYLPKSLKGAIEDYPVTRWFDYIFSNEKILDLLEECGYTLRKYLEDNNMIK